MAQAIKQVAWCDAAAAGLARALPSSAILEIVANEVRSGVSRLWHCRDGEHEAYCVTRIDLNPTQLVIVAFEGSGMKVFGPWFVARAHAQGIPVRAHVTDPRVERLLRIGLRFRRSEIVLLCESEAICEQRRQGQLARDHAVAVVHH